MSECVQVSTTLPDEATAQRLGARLVEERLAACAQVVGPVSSTYWWQGQVEQAKEWCCHLKTTADTSQELSRRLRELHPLQAVDEPLLRRHVDVILLRSIDPLGLLTAACP